MANQEADVQLQRLEKEANQLKENGNILGALETLEKAMEIEKRWYHLHTKVYWLSELWMIESTEEKMAEMWKIAQEGFSRFPDHRFWFSYLRADLRRQAVLFLLSKSPPNLENLLLLLSEAQKDIDAANYELRKKPQIVKETLDNPPCLLPIVWHSLNIKDVSLRVDLSTMTIRSIQQVITLSKFIFDAEERINSKIAKQEVQMQSEKMRTIEILGFFTAIMAFIILIGNAAFKTTYKEAMPILGGLALVLILFVTVASLVTSKFERRRDILKDVRSWLVFSLIIILSFLVWDSQRKKQNPDVPSANKSQSTATAEVIEVLEKEK